MHLPVDILEAAKKAVHRRNWMRYSFQVLAMSIVTLPGPIAAKAGGRDTHCTVVNTVHTHHCVVGQGCDYGQPPQRVCHRNPRRVPPHGRR